MSVLVILGRKCRLATLRAALVSQDQYEPTGQTGGRMPDRRDRYITLSARRGQRTNAELIYEVCAWFADADSDAE